MIEIFSTKTSAFDLHRPHAQLSGRRTPPTTGTAYRRTHPSCPLPARRRDADSLLEHTNRRWNSAWITACQRWVWHCKENSQHTKV